VSFLPFNHSISSSVLAYTFARPAPGTRWTGRPRVISHRLTVRSSRPKKAPISFQVSRRLLGPRVLSEGLIVPIFPDLSSIAVCTVARVTGLYLVHSVEFTIFIFSSLPCVGGTDGPAPGGNEFPGSFPTGVASVALPSRWPD